MKRYIFAIVFPLFALSALAAKTEELYMLYNRSDGSKLYYIREQPMTATNGGKGQLTYDITYIDSDTLSTWRLSVTVSMRLRIDSIGFRRGTTEQIVPVTLLYREPAKKDWEHRIEVALPYSVTQTLFAPNPALQIVVYHADGRCIFTRSPQKDWVNLCTQMRDVFWVIENDRR